MQPSILLLAISLVIADTAFAGPCRPKYSTSRASATVSTSSTTQSTSTAGAVSTTTSLTESVTSTSDISSSSSIASATQSTSSTVVSSGISIETITSSTSAAISASASTSATTPVVTTSSTSSSVASSTTAAPAATPTFTIVGGGGSVNGDPLQGLDQDGTILVFNPQLGNIRPRTFILDPNTGRLTDKDTGVPVCAYYGFATSASTPASLAFCQIGNTGPNSFYDYLTCQISGGKLACVAPRASCNDDDSGVTVCTTEPGTDVNSQFYYKARQGAGTYAYISNGSPGGYSSVDLIAQVA